MDLLAVQPGDRVLDCTVGLGGHATAMAKAAGRDGLLIGLDVDQAALDIAAKRLQSADCPFRLFRANFDQFDETLAQAEIPSVNVILADLGVSSLQFDKPDRGFSFQADGPLDMRMDDRIRESACDLVNRLEQSALADLIYQYGQERRSRRIAKFIHRARKGGRITTTHQLSQIVCKALGVDPRSRKSRIHPATRTFQALRIAVNQELAALATLLRKAPAFLAPNARLGVISFHSLEDAMVKRDFIARRGEEIYQIVTNKPVAPGDQEIRSNPRSRSAKLRVVRRTAHPVT